LSPHLPNAETPKTVSEIGALDCGVNFIEDPKNVRLAENLGHAAARHAGIPDDVARQLTRGSKVRVKLNKAFGQVPAEFNASLKTRGPSFLELSSPSKASADSVLFSSRSSNQWRY